MDIFVVSQSTMSEISRKLDMIHSQGLGVHAHTRYTYGIRRPTYSIERASSMIHCGQSQLQATRLSMNMDNFFGFYLRASLYEEISPGTYMERQAQRLA